jgi:putative ABC transport system permease protein
MILNLRMAWRNLWRHKRRTWLTATAMIFSNVLLVFMISLQFGSYDMMINNTLQSFSGHFQVQKDGYNDNPKLRLSIESIQPLATEMRRSMPETRVAARAAAFALASSEQRSFGVQVIGVQPEFEAGVSTIPGLVKQGSFLDDPNAAEIVIGAVMARNLKVGIGDEITLLGSGRDGSFAAGVLRVMGIYESGSQEMDRSFAEIPLGYFQEMFAMGDHGNSIAVAVDSLDLLAPELVNAQQAINGREGLLVLDWNNLHPGLKQAIQADLTSAWFMYSVLIVLVAFSVLNTQLMSVLERTREFGTMMALGLKPSRLARLVMTETVMMAGLGLGLGVLIGFIITAYLSVVGFSYPGMEEMAVRFNLPDRMYPSISLLSLMLGPGIVAIGSLLAAMYPALRLYLLLPIEAMRAV